MANTDSRAAPLVLLTGASGFVGRHLAPALLSLGFQVRCGSREPRRAAALSTVVDWCPLDLDEPSTVRDALSGATHAVYLVHSMLSGKKYAARERRAAETFRAAADHAGLHRIAYLGGVAPANSCSEHLQSRLSTGRILRSGTTPTVELRAAMVLGHGSASWQLVRDLTVRMPPMLLPEWLNHKSSPIAIDDVVLALAAAVTLPLQTAWYDLPGPETLSHRELFAKVGNVVGRRFSPIPLPLVTPPLSAYWLAAFTRVPYVLAKELVHGLQSDLLPTGPNLFDKLPAFVPRSLDRAIHDAFEDESSTTSPSPTTVSRITTRLQTLKSELARIER